MSSPSKVGLSVEAEFTTNIKNESRESDATVFETPARDKSKEKVEDNKEIHTTPIQDLSQVLANKPQNHKTGTGILLQTPLIDNESGIIALCEAPVAKIRPRPETSSRSMSMHSLRKLPSPYSASPSRSGGRGRANGATCVECGEYRHKYDFTKSQWRNRPRGFRRCKYCTGEGGTDSRISSYDNSSYTNRSGGNYTAQKSSYRSPFGTR